MNGSMHPKPMELACSKHSVGDLIDSTYETEFFGPAKWNGSSHDHPFFVMGHNHSEWAHDHPHHDH